MVAVAAAGTAALVTALSTLRALLFGTKRMSLSCSAKSSLSRRKSSLSRLGSPRVPVAVVRMSLVEPLGRRVVRALGQGDGLKNGEMLVVVHGEAAGTDYVAQ